MAYKPNQLDVTLGGTGVLSNTAYAVLCGGTTSTGAIQSIASLGSSGQVLKSNGAGALPTAQNVSRFAINLTPVDESNPASATTYYVSVDSTINTSQTNAGSWLYIPIDCTLDSIYGKIGITGTLGSNQNVQIFLRKNNTTDITVTSTSQWTANPTNFSATNLNTALSAGDYLQLKVITPSWGTVPTQVSWTFAIGFK